MLFGRRKEKEKPRRSKQLINIAVIISITLTVIKLVYRQLITIETAALVLIGTVILLAIGNTIAKILVAIVCVCIFLFYATGGNQIAFNEALSYFLALVFVLFAIYVMFGGLRRKR